MGRIKCIGGMNVHLKREGGGGALVAEYCVEKGSNHLTFKICLFTAASHLDYKYTLTTLNHISYAYIDRRRTRRRARANKAIQVHTHLT